MTGDTFHCGITLADFEPWEFFCPCCGTEKMDKQTLLKIQRLRSKYNKVLNVVEGGGYRCEKYEPSETSAHREGRAIDPSYPIADHWLLLTLGILGGFKGIGDKCEGGRWQLHLDNAGDIPGIRPRPWKWTY